LELRLSVGFFLNLAIGLLVVESPQLMQIDVQVLVIEARHHAVHDKARHADA
jgi:hypothetical protein